jgi:hypothetical protein
MPYSRIFTLILFLASTFYLFFKCSAFYAVYNANVIIQKEGLWLYGECQQPDFSRNLGPYTDACEQINLVFQKTPFTTAIESIQTSIRKEWNNNMIIILGMIICILFVIIMIPPYISFIQRRERDRLDMAVYSHQCNIRSRKAVYIDNASLRHRTLQHWVNV